MPALLSHYRPNFSIFAFTGGSHRVCVLQLVCVGVRRINPLVFSDWPIYTLPCPNLGLASLPSASPRKPSPPFPPPHTLNEHACTPPAPVCSSAADNSEVQRHLAFFHGVVPLHIDFSDSAGEAAAHT